MKEWKRELIEFLIKNKVFRFGNFIVRTGEKKNFRYSANWINNPKVLNEIANAYAKEIKEEGFEFDALLAISYSAIPITSLLAVKLNKPFAYDKKELRNIERKWLIGEIPENAKVIIIDDSLVNGEAKLEFLKKLKENKPNLKPQAIVILIDLQETQNPLKAIQGIPIHSILKLEQIKSMKKELNKNSDKK